MKKKILLGILVLLVLFAVTGCGNKTEEITDDSGKTNEKVETSNLKVGNVSVDLSSSGSFHAISYKYPKDATTGNVGTFAIMDLMNGENLVVRIAMYYFENKSMGEVNAGEGLSRVDAIEYNNNTWNVYEGKKDGKNVMNYVTQEGDDSYTITFLSDEDISKFSNEFMKTVVFNR